MTKPNEDEESELISFLSPINTKTVHEDIIKSGSSESSESNDKLSECSSTSKQSIKSKGVQKIFNNVSITTYEPSKV